MQLSLWVSHCDSAAGLLGMQARLLVTGLAEEDAASKLQGAVFGFHDRRQLRQLQIKQAAEVLQGGFAVPFA